MRQEFLPTAQGPQRGFVEKINFLGVIAVFFILAQPFEAFADAVYLKNGVVMMGRIIEKNPQYLVLKTSEDADAVRVTIFLEDIYKIEAQNVFVEKLKFVPYELLHKVSEVFPPPGTGSLKPPENVSAPQGIRSLLEKDRRYKLDHILKKNAGDEALSDDRQEALKPLKEAGQETDTSSIKQEAVLEVLKPVEMGDGRISGSVILPDLPYEKRKRGDLYVYLMQDLGSNRFAFGANMLFEKISYKNIASRKVSYKIEHIPAGRYKVFAQWDIEIPFVKEKIIDKDKRVLGYIGAKGDYSGSCEGVIDLVVHEKKEGVDFNCLDIIRQDQFSFDLGRNPLVDVKDLYYRKLPTEAGKIFLLVTNTNDGVVNLAAFDILINDEKVMPLPFQLNMIEPKSEKEFDITQIYYQYKAAKEAKGEGDPGPTLRFKVVWPATGEVVFEKVLTIL